jgi:hypothetical protein
MLIAAFPDRFLDIRFRGFGILGTGLADGDQTLGFRYLGRLCVFHRTAPA